MLIIRPEGCGKAYIIAAENFRTMCEKTTGIKAEISDKDDGKSDIAVIGTDAVNEFLADEIFLGNTGDLNIRYGTDDYLIRTYKKDGRNVLVLAGGRGRSTLYAVWGYFEKYMNCRYYWDGDVIPESENMVTEGIDEVFSPRFFYRGLRYFAHRGLHRFQAEHWSFDDWKNELDWMTKKRLNFFMLRIGMDDAWQRAFPDTVHYAEGFKKSEQETTYRDGYDDRTDFWTAKERGKLRERIMDYAGALDIMSPTDTGTMTHWYSRTPMQFLESHDIKFLEQADSQYNKYDTGKVFDFRIKENMDYYTKLTKTMATEYDKNSNLFHTIGLGERRIYKDNEKNFRLKKLCYRIIAERIREEYPNSKLLVGTWDFVGWWRPEEVQCFIRELDPERTVILDYTSEGKDEIQNFTSWGIENKFPWIFGLFHAYESESELRGNYKITDERLKRAAEDDYCKGMIFWPELSHSDPIILEYLAENSWAPGKYTVEKLIDNYCFGRYKDKYKERMNSAWQKFLPFLKLSSWGGYKKVSKEGESFRTDSFWCTHSDIFVKPTWFLRNYIKNTEVAKYYENTVKRAILEAEALAEAVNSLAKINDETDSLFTVRDSIDIVRTAAGRFLNYIMAKCTYGFGSKIDIKEAKKHYMALLALLAEVLHYNDDFSLYASLKRLSDAAVTNPDFEATLKNNILNEYCSQYCAELADSVFKYEAEKVFEWFDEPYEIGTLWKNAESIFESFKKTPLETMQREPSVTLSEAMRGIAREIAEISEILK